MVSLLRRRGPDGEGWWVEGAIGLGRCALHSTPESAGERQPLVSEHLAVAADARLDNRGELARELALPPHSGDAVVIAAAYGRWGRACPERLEGDFAFALWDRRQRRLLAARDRFGVRPLYIHHQPGRLLALASEPAAILVLEEVPYRINEARIADFLVTRLEGVDLVSTFFEGVERLPPAHLLTADDRGVRQRRYWQLEPGPELRLGSDEAYAEAFFEVFGEAVRRRLRGAATVGAMLSGGMDSGSIVAVAQELRRLAGEGPLPTFSAVGSDPGTCVETRTILAAQAMGGLEPHSISSLELAALLPELAELGLQPDEPFDHQMALVRAVYLIARRRGVRAVLDGIDGDTVLGEGSHLTRLVRSGRWLSAWREAVGQNRFWGGACPARRELALAAYHAFAPAPIKGLAQRLRARPDALAASLAGTIIARSLAERVRLGERLAALAAHAPAGLDLEPAHEHARTIAHPYLTVGVERYGRVAAALGLEPRHPFLDRRLVELCVALPGEQKLRDGWPKAVLRRGMAGRLPDTVRRQRGKEHLGWAFTIALMRAARERLRRTLEAGGPLLRPYIERHRLEAAAAAWFERGDESQAEAVLQAAVLAGWLEAHDVRPRAPRLPEATRVTYTRGEGEPP
jgi:asparagine synthase (glutamine-hydrolysing)